MSALHHYREALVAAAGAAVIIIPFTGSHLWLYNMLIVAIFAIVAIGLGIVTGRAGQVSFAQTSFMAVGGYGIAILTTRYHWHPWLALGVSAVVAAGAALIVGVPLLRLRGHYLAMGTFALALGTSSLATAAGGFTGGAIGISGIPPLRLGPISFQDQTNAYWLCWAVVAMALATFAALNWSFVGRAWRALALREDVAAGLGINVHSYKTLAFVIAAVMASVGGSLYVGITSFVAPDIYDATTAINMFVILFIGGRGTVFGPVLGSILVIIGPQLFSSISAWQNVIFLVVLLLVILFMPQGLLGGGPLERTWKWPRWLRWGAPGGGLAVVPHARPTADPVRLAATGIRKAFGGVVAVQNASITVADGQVAGLIGPNGSGKSTLLSVLSGFQRPDLGAVSFQGKDVGRLGPTGSARLGVIRTFQEAAPIRGLSVLDNVLVGMHLRFRGGPLAALLRTPGMRAQERAMRGEAHALLQLLALDPLANVDAARLTFGQLRFLEIVRALAARPRLLLVDEPTAGLNKIEADMLADLIRRIRDEGLGLLIVDHNVPFLFDICASITVMNYGAVIAEGPPHAIANEAAVRDAYLGTEQVVEASQVEAVAQ